MLPDPAVQLPASLMALLASFGPLFTAPSFRTFCALAAGFLAQPGKRTVCGMLTGAGLSRLWSHHRAHRFFSHARWSADALGLALAKLVVALLAPPGDPVLVAVDDTLFRRAGKKVHAIGWFHDGSVKGPHQVGLGNNWVVCAVVVRLPFMSRPVALPVTVTRYGKTTTIQAAAITCLWHGVFGARPVQVILIRDRSRDGHDLALATTDLAVSPAAVIERYASRRSIEVAIEDAKQIFGAGEARNRLPAAVHRTVPFTLACQGIAMPWHATAGHDPGDAGEHRTRAPWYRTKAEPSTADMIAKLRRVIIAARYLPAHPAQPTPEEIHAIRLAWEGIAA